MGKLSSIPFLRPTLALVMGAFAGLFIPFLNASIHWHWLLMLLVVSAVFSLWVAKYRTWEMISGFFLMFSFSILGILLATFAQSSSNKSFFASEQNKQSGYRALKVKLTGDIQEKQNTWRTSAEVIAAIDSNGQPFEVSGNLLVYWPFKKNKQIPKLGLGDILWIPNRSMDMPRAAFPEDFDFKAVMRYKDVQHQIFLMDDDWVKVGNETSPILNGSNIARNYIIEVVSKAFSEREAGVLQSLLVGFKDNVDKEDLNSFAVSGTMHVLAVSGMHVGLIYVFLVLIFTGKIKNANLSVWQGLFVIVALWAYAFITGLSASVLRAAIMFTIIEAGRSVFRKPHHVMNSFFAAAFIQLCLYPLNLVDAGFQLSYLAVLGIIYLYPVVSEWYKPKSAVVDYVYQLGLVSVCATIATLPVTLYFFGSFPVWFVVANILIVPLSSLIIFTAIGFLIFSKIMFVGLFFQWLTSTLCKWMLMLAAGIANLPNASITHIDFSIWDVFFLLSVSSLIAVYFNTKQKILLWQSSVLCFLWTISTIHTSYNKYHSKELICAELRGHAVCAVKKERNLYIFTSDVTKSKSDTLLGFIQSYIQKYKIQNVEWNRPNVLYKCHEIVKRDKSGIEVQISNSSEKKKIHFAFAPISALKGWVENDVIVLQNKYLARSSLNGYSIVSLKNNFYRVEL